MMHIQIMEIMDSDYRCSNPKCGKWVLKNEGNLLQYEIGGKPVCKECYFDDIGEILGQYPSGFGFFSPKEEDRLVIASK
jgi:hypothetical protein